MNVLARRNFVAGAAVLVASQGVMKAARADDRADAIETVELAMATLERVLGDSVMSGFNNALGGARGILLMPKLVTAGFLVGYTSGTGVLLARHAARWSDGVFVQLHQPSGGFQAGVQSAQTLMLLMANGAPESLLKGTLEVGGSGGFSLGNLGIGGGASGGVSSGLNVLSVNYANGLFAGSSFSGMRATLDAARNAGLYGASFDARRAIAAPGTNATMGALRQALDAATAKAQRG